MPSLPAIIFRTTDALLRWAGVGRPLTWAEHDGVHYNLDNRITAIESDPSTVVSIASITSDTSGRDLYVNLTNSTTDGPFPLPVTELNPRLLWAPSTFYAVNDIFVAAGNVYRAIFPFISPSSFDPGANDGMGHDLYQLYIPLPGNSLPTGGAVGQFIQKSTTTDFAVTWGWPLPTGGTIYQVLLKNSSTNQDASWTTLNALHVAFAPSTASGLTSTDVADALEELGDLIAAVGMTYLPLAGGTLTGPLILAADPTTALGAATKQYVDGLVGGGGGALSGLSDVNVTEGAGIDGYALCWKNADTKWEAKQLAAVAISGAYADVSGTPTLGTASSHAAGDFAQTTNNLSDLANAATARGNLGVATSSIEYVMDGGGSTLTTGMKGYIEVPFACTITQATLLADQSGSVVVDVFKCSYANFDAGSTHPVSGDKITASAPPTISTATKAQDATLTGWTTSLSAGDILAFNVNSVTTIQRVTLSLRVTR